MVIGIDEKCIVEPDISYFSTDVGLNYSQRRHQKKPICRISDSLCKHPRLSNVHLYTHLIITVIYYKFIPPHRRALSDCFKATSQLMFITHAKRHFAKN